MHAGEELSACIRRELSEELGIEVDEPVFLHTLEHHYPEKSIRLHFLLVPATPDLQPRALEHADIAWVDIASLKEVDLAPADRRFAEWLTARKLAETKI